MKGLYEHMYVLPEPAEGLKIEGGGASGHNLPLPLVGIGLTSTKICGGQMNKIR